MQAKTILNSITCSILLVLFFPLFSALSYSVQAQDDASLLEDLKEGDERPPLLDLEDKLKTPEKISKDKENIHTSPRQSTRPLSQLDFDSAYRKKKAPLPADAPAIDNSENPEALELELNDLGSAKP